MPEPAADAPSIAPDHEAPPKPDEPKAEALKAETPTVEAPKHGAAGDADTKPEPKTGKLIVMAPSDRSWKRDEFADVKVDASQDTGGKRRLSAMAAMVAVAALVGAVSGALATAGVMHLAANEAPGPVNNSALETTVARIDADIVALKASLEQTGKAGVSQFNRTSDRLDKLEKAQAEPMARIAKLSEAMDKLRAAPPALSAQAAAKETTGSITPAQAAVPAQAAAPAVAPPKTEVGRLPTVEGWRLRDVARGGALIEGRSGLYEVYAGDPVPGLGRIDAIRRQDGRWVVVTSKGLIVAR
jgi:hypothetical protein